MLHVLTEVSVLPALSRNCGIVVSAKRISDKFCRTAKNIISLRERNIQMKYIFNEARSHTKQLHCKVRKLMRKVSLSVNEAVEGATCNWCRESQQRGVSVCFTIKEEVPIEGSRWPMHS